MGAKKRPATRGASRRATNGKRGGGSAARVTARSATPSRVAARRAGVPSIAASVIARLVAGSPALPGSPLDAVIARLVRGAPGLPELPARPQVAASPPSMSRSTAARRGR
jgi:hypothetical protein